MTSCLKMVLMFIVKGIAPEPPPGSNFFTWDNNNFSATDSNNNLITD